MRIFGTKCQCLSLAQNEPEHSLVTGERLLKLRHQFLLCSLELVDQLSTVGHAKGGDRMFVFCGSSDVFRIHCFTELIVVKLVKLKFKKMRLCGGCNHCG